MFIHLQILEVSKDHIYLYNRNTSSSMVLQSTTRHRKPNNKQIESKPLTNENLHI